MEPQLASDSENAKGLHRLRNAKTVERVAEKSRSEELVHPVQHTRICALQDITKFLFSLVDFFFFFCVNFHTCVSLLLHESLTLIFALILLVLALVCVFCSVVCATFQF